MPSLAQTVCAVAVCFAAKAALGLWPHSGLGSPPLWGDLEAQRHWMEVTVHTRLGEWYVHTPTNDLLYWGLDYPPLT